MVDTQDLKSCGQQCPCRFKSGLGHFIRTVLNLLLIAFNAEVAQLVEHNLAKVRVARSNRVFCSSM